MMMGSKTSPETGVGSLGGEGNSRWLGCGCVGCTDGGESRESGGGGDLTFEVIFSADGLEPAWGECCVELESRTSGAGLEGERSRLLDPSGSVCSLTSGESGGLAVRSSSSTSFSEINRMGGNLERPSVGRELIVFRSGVGNSRTDNNFMSGN